MRDFSAQNVLEQFQAALKAPISEPIEAATALRWLALVPCWPEKVAEQGFPLGTRLALGEPVHDALQQLVAGGWVDYVDAVAPWDGSVYRMRRAQRRRVFEIEGNREQPDRSLLDEAAAAWRQLQSVSARFTSPYPLVVRHWGNLLALADGGRSVQPADVADRLIKAVQATLKSARELGLEESPEAATVLDAAEPLVMALGGPMLIASARCQRELELYQRRTRDNRLLKNYQDRLVLERAFERLLEKDSRWALHYIGAGGVGKTMFLRHLQSKYGEKLRLAISRVDFDHLNPSYPLRSPGLLLLSFADELKLEAPESAIDLFRKLEYEVSLLHTRLDAARRDGKDVRLGFEAAGFDLCLLLFADALSAIERSGRRPVLILDTCEELARLRFDGELPDTLVETFRILEDLHRRLPSLRVVFSGRRPLAREGVDWVWEKEVLPKRDFLLLCPILGFSRGEALALLQRYQVTQDGIEAGVPVELRDRILELSKSDEGDEPSRLSRKDAAGRVIPADDDRSSEVRYNPFDVDLYAGWAAADRTLTVDKLRKAGRHHYVRERIVSRLRDDVQKILPHLIVLGRFDEALVGELARNTGDRKTLWAEVRQQEWTDIDRGARDADDTAPAFWNLDQQMRVRLEAYYVDEMPGAWSASRHEVAGILERLTIERHWSSLTPSYFDVSTEILREDPERAAEWWSKVESKILTTGAWDWADSISAALLDPIGRLGSALQRDDRNPLAAPIRALRANVLMRALAEDESLCRLWEEVGSSSTLYPNVAGRVLLDFRARAGQIAYSRYRSGLLAEAVAVDESGGDFGQSWVELTHLQPGKRFRVIIESLPPLKKILELLVSSDGPAMQRQAIHTEIGLLDNAVETLEQVEWANPPQDLLKLLMERAAPLAKHLRSTAWMDLYVQRLKAIGGAPDPDWSWRDLWQTDVPPVLRTAAFDWVPPREQDIRRLLECGRLLEGTKDAGQTSAFALTALQRVKLPSNLDQDRLMSQALRLLPEPPANVKDLVPSSIALATKREECEAHRKVPPLFVTAIQLTAAAGDIDAALEMLRLAREGQPAEPLVRWLDRLAVHLNTQFLLAEPSRVDARLPELPARQGDPVAAFMKAAAASLASASSDTLSAKDLARVRELATTVCAKRGFPLPGRASDLGKVAPGWQPWLARYLALRWFAESRGDKAELEALKDRFVGFYGTALPADVAFLEPDERASHAASATLTRGWATRLLGCVTLAAASGYGALATARAGAGYITGRSVSLWESALWLFGGLMFAGFASVAIVFLLRQYALLGGRLQRNTSTLTDLADGRVSVESRVEFIRAVSWISRLFNSRSRLRIIPLPDLKPYRELAEAFGSSGTGARRLPLTLLETLAGRGRTDHVLVVTGDTGSLARPCWEAILGTILTYSLVQCPFAFRRVADNSWKMEDPFIGTMNALAVSSIRDLSAWKALLKKPDRIKGRNVGAFPNSARHTDVGILIVQADVSLSDRDGIRFSTQADSSSTFTPSDVARVFPNLRIFVLLGIDRGDLTRTLSDRLTAQQVRMAAQELFRKAAPIVIAIPGLPFTTSLVDEALEIIIRRVIQEHANAVWPLQRAVRDIQDHIFQKCHLEPDEATELAYDVCYYAADRVSMSVDILRPTSSPKPTASRKRGERERARVRSQRSARA